MNHRPVIANIYISQPNKNNKNFYIGYSKGKIVNTREKRGITEIVSYETFSNSVGFVDAANGEARGSLDGSGWLLAGYVNVGIPNDNDTYDFLQIEIDYLGENTIEGFYPAAVVLNGKADLYTKEKSVSAWEPFWFKLRNSYREYEKFGCLIRIERIDDDGYFGNFNIYINAHENR